MKNLKKEKKDKTGTQATLLGTYLFSMWLGALGRFWHCRSILGCVLEYGTVDSYWTIAVEPGRPVIDYFQS